MCKLQVNTVVRVNYYLVFMLEKTFPLNIEPIKNKPMMIGKIIYQLFNDGKLLFYAENNLLEEWEELHKTKEIPLLKTPISIQ